MKRQSKAPSYLRTVMVILALMLPALSLLPLGSLWLWERGYLLYWIAIALVLTVSTFLIELWLVSTPKHTAPDSISEQPSNDTGDQTMPDREAAAWAAVEALAATAVPSKFVNRDAFLDLGIQTIEAVAKCMHPTDSNPLWRFTVPEALALVERVSHELRPFVVDNIPLGDQMTVGQVMKIYRWRSVFDVAEKAYDLWRIVRLINPVTAVASEAREHLTKNLYSGVRDQLAHRMIGGYVREVGRAAIDLYSGRLRVIEVTPLPAAAPGEAPPAPSWTWKKLWSQTKGGVGATTRGVTRSARRDAKK